MEIKNSPAKSRLAGLLFFPNPVNEVSARLVAAGVVVLSAAILLSQQWWLTPLLAYGFIARVLSGPRFSPLAWLVTKHVTPRLGWRPKMVAGPPKRFAQGIGAVVSTTAAVLALVFHNTTAASVMLGMLIVAASLEAFVGLCVGCKIFALLMKAGLIPDEVCAACNNVGVPASSDATSQPTTGRQ